MVYGSIILVTKLSDPGVRLAMKSSSSYIVLRIRFLASFTLKLLIVGIHMDPKLDDG